MTAPVSPRVGLLAWLLAVAIALCGCATPTLPPDDPPAPDQIELGVGVARLQGRVNTGPAFVLVLNRVNGLLFGQQTPDGFYDFEVRTEPCDALALWYTVGSGYGLHGGEWKMVGGAAHADSILIASEPLTRDVNAWVEVPEYSILHAEVREGRPRVAVHYLD